MSKTAKTLRGFLRKHDPALLLEVKRAQISSAAILDWPPAQISGLRFFGDPPSVILWMGDPMMTILGLNLIDGTAAWQGVAPEHLQYGDQKEILWARPKTADPAGFAVRLNRALTAWGVSPSPLPGSQEEGVLGRIMIEEAADTGDLAALQQALRNYAGEDPSEYGRALSVAACRGDLPFVRALVDLFGPWFEEDAFSSCEQGDDAPQRDRDEVFGPAARRYATAALLQVGR